ncbi:AbrB family transcriptional regulator [Amantichitinum ursilacus]|uniref:Putative ammonia monooxygenase n=1 Tax=Amantichitinum ursilacus TaxID=857265 RepID=A0A0N0GQE0_9NEIS|nr:AbrB family transcriptional regulator [Amantichitinum ursilacus]KPC54600.1 putative ammonia monooxygenase [Amantichitinum ursilacus]
MPTSSDHAIASGFAGRPRAVQWLALVLLSMLLAGGLLLLQLPAALLLGPLVAGIIISVAGAKLQVPAAVGALSQALLGCMIAHMLPGWSATTALAAHWLLFVLGVLAVIGISAALGWALSRLDILPGTTALWGLSPGAATAMTLMAEAYGADVQMVAFMQYVRVLLVALIASLIAHSLGLNASHGLAGGDWWAPVSWLALAQTLAVAVVGIVLAHGLRWRVGALLLPLILGAALSQTGWVHLAMPPWLIALLYAAIGWRIGLRFTLPLLRHVARALPRVLASSLALIAACGGLGMLLVWFDGVDPLTAYLATSPGGADTAAIIAASTSIDVQFVMTMQMARLLAVLLLGPPLVRLLAAQIERRRHARAGAGA